MALKTLYPLSSVCGSVDTKTLAHEEIRERSSKKDIIINNQYVQGFVHIHANHSYDDQADALLCAQESSWFPFLWHLSSAMFLTAVLQKS